MKITLTILSLLSAVLLTGCVGIVFPVPSDGRTYGKVITREQAGFIVPGKTTREEVLARLGDQFRASPRLPALAYSWEKPATGWAWGIVVLSGEASVGGGGHLERSHWQALFVRFDDSGRIVSTKFVSLSGRKSLDEQLEDWAANKENASTGIGAKIFDPENGAPRIMEELQQSMHP